MTKLKSLSGQEVPPEDLPDNSSLSGQEVPPEDQPETSTAQSGQEVPPEDLPEEAKQDQYATPGQQVLTGIESLGRGVTGGLSDVLAVGMRKGASALGVPEQYLHYVAPEPSHIEARKEANPVESTAGELAGNIALMNKLPQIGSKALNGMLQMGLISSGDELSKAILGVGDPASAVAMHIAGSSALGLVGGAIAGKAEKLANKGLQSIEDAKMGSKLSSFLTGAGHAASFPGQEAVPLAGSALTELERAGLDDKAFKLGQEYFNSYLVDAPKYIGRVAAPILGEHLGGWGGAAASSVLEQIIERVAPNASQKIAPVILKAAASGHVEKMSELLNHATTMSKGASKIATGVSALFNGLSNKAIEETYSDKDREKLRKFIEDGGTEEEVRNSAQRQGIPTQGFSKGGMVLPHVDQSSAIEKVYPEQNILLNAAKSRVSGFLNSVRPVKNNTLPFDTDHENPQHKREYDKMLDLAQQPLSILNKIKDGSLLPSHVKAITSMYPELHTELSKQITEKMAKHQLDEEKRPKYHTRQALSLFLGSSLDSTLTQPVMAAAQQSFINQNAQKQQMAASKASGLAKMAKGSMTPQQGAEARLNKN